MRVIVFFLFGLSLVQAEDEGGYSYHKFRGPVSGEIQEVVVPSHHPHGHQRLDYVAKPDYVYSYGVEDPQTGNSQTHSETRDGDAVTGEYRVLQADGIMRIVKYVADGANGFRATIHYEKP